MKNRKRKVAVFDIDGTIFRSSLLIEITDALVLKNIFPKQVQTAYSRAKASWLDRKDDYDKYLWEVIKAFDHNIRGVAFKDFEAISAEVVKLQKDRVYRYTRDLVKNLKRKNYFILAISHSPKAAVDAFAKKMGFDKVYGLLFELSPAGRFTGKKMIELIADKAKILNRAVLKENLTLKDSYGVGDTDSDIPMLSIVDNPIAFNPNQKLYDHAMKKKWKIVVERKNVTYELKN